MESEFAESHGNVFGFCGSCFQFDFLFHLAFEKSFSARFSKFAGENSREAKWSLCVSHRKCFLQPHSEDEALEYHIIKASSYRCWRGRKRQACPATGKENPTAPRIHPHPQLCFVLLYQWFHETKLGKAHMASFRRPASHGVPLLCCTQKIQSFKIEG